MYHRGDVAGGDWDPVRHQSAARGGIQQDVSDPAERSVGDTFNAIIRGDGARHPDVTSGQSMYDGSRPGPAASPPLHYGDNMPMNVDQEMQSSMLFHDMFSQMFTFTAFAIFSYPFVASMYLGTQRTVQYWVGPYGLLALAVPIIFLTFYCIQVKLDTPRRVLVLVSTLTPCILFMTIGNIHHGASYDLADQLLSTDCTTFHSKRELDREWWTAHTFYMDCMRKMSTTPGPDGKTLPLADAMQVYRIHHCEGYAEAKEELSTDWDYLSYVEDMHLCSGWCQPGPRLWTFKDTKDACSIAVGHLFLSEVQRVSQQITVFSLLSLCLSAVAIFLGPALMRAHKMSY